MRFAAIVDGPPLTPKALDAYCAEHGLVVPEPLRVQLLDQNGGAPEDEVLIPVAGQDEEMMALLGAGMKDKSYDLAWIAKTMEGRIPDGLLPFADDPGGNLFVVEIDDARGHPVWFWDHELEGEPDALTPVSATLDEFLSMLRNQLSASLRSADEISFERSMRGWLDVQAGDRYVALAEFLQSEVGADDDGELSRLSRAARTEGQRAEWSGNVTSLTFTADGVFVEHEYVGPPVHLAHDIFEEIMRRWTAFVAGARPEE